MRQEPGGKKTHAHTRWLFHLVAGFYGNLCCLMLPWWCCREYSVVLMAPVTLNPRASEKVDPVEQRWGSSGEINTTSSHLWRRGTRTDRSWKSVNLRFTVCRFDRTHMGCRYKEWDWGAKLSSQRSPTLGQIRSEPLINTYRTSSKIGLNQADSNVTGSLWLRPIQHTTKPS